MTANGYRQKNRTLFSLVLPFNADAQIINCVKQVDKSRRLCGSYGSHNFKMKHKRNVYHFISTLWCHALERLYDTTDIIW